MKKDKQTIKCDVHDCTHCNCDDDSCKLNEIKVCNCNNNEDKESTMCDSYSKKEE